MSTVNHEEDLSLAIAANAIDIVKEILELPDFDPMKPGKRGVTPLFMACAYGRVEIVRLLLERRADINERCRYTGLTPLHVAASNGFSDVVAILLGNGLDPRIRDATGSTALDYAEISPQYLELSHVTEERSEKGDECLIRMRHGCVGILTKTNKKILSKVAKRVAAVRGSLIGKAVPVDVEHDVNQTLRTRIRMRKRVKLNGLAVRDIPSFGFAVKEIPRLERDKGHIGINLIVSPPSLRS